MSRILYFDINGTIVLGDSNTPKPKLAHGGLEAALKSAGVDQVVCVSSIAVFILQAVELGRERDPIGALFKACSGTFLDLDWFREHVIIPEKPSPRVACIDETQDWWYMDDAAEYYCGQAKRYDLYNAWEGSRILVPSPLSDGSEALKWIQNIAPAAKD